MSLVATLPGIFVMQFLGAGLGEELGWRGWALSLLLRKYSALSAGLLVGVSWALWHVPDFMRYGGRYEYQSKFFLFVVAIIAWSLIFTWIYLRTKQSTLIAAIFHASNNAMDRWLERVYPGSSYDDLAWYIGTVLMLAVATALFVAGQISRRPLNLGGLASKELPGY